MDGKRDRTWRENVPAVQLTVNVLGNTTVLSMNGHPTHHGSTPRLVMNPRQPVLKARHHTRQDVQSSTCTPIGTLRIILL